MRFTQNDIYYNCITENKVVVEGFVPNINLSAIYIPRYLKNGYMVVGILSSAFSGNLILEQVFIPDTICFIEKKAFHACANLKEIGVICFDSQYSYVPETDIPIRIDEEAFLECAKLSKFASLTQISKKSPTSAKQVGDELLSPLNSTIITYSLSLFMYYIIYKK